MTDQDRLAALAEYRPDWRTLKHDNGAPMYSERTGMLLDDRGNRSVFDDVDE